MIKIALCDDNEIDRTILKNYLDFYFGEKQIEYAISAFSNGEELLANYHKNDFHLLFLDIYMNNLDGIATGRAIRSLDMDLEIIYCTSSPEFALESYELMAFGYLVKPFNRARMQMILDKYLHNSSHTSYKSISVKSKYEDIIIFIKEIVYIESNDKVLLFHLNNQEVVRTYGKLSDIMEKLEAPCFLRCHQSYIINMNYIRSIEDHDFITIHNTIIPIRRRECHKMKDSYFQYKRNIGKSDTARR